LQLRTNAYLENVAYKPNDKVVKDGIEYTCKAWPNGAWCASPIYKPGSALSSRAWSTDGGIANVVESDTDIRHLITTRVFSPSVFPSIGTRLP
jgi:hypothetical protein